MFDVEIATRCGFACQFAYEPSEFLTKILEIDANQPQICADETEVSSATVLTYSATATKPAMRIVAFQGTITRDVQNLSKNQFDAVRDWINNFKVQMVPGSALKSFRVAGNLHQGFAAQLDCIYPKIRQALGADMTVPIYVTGHSQGGAVAAIATQALTQNGYPVKAAYTFAAPRPGNLDFARSVAPPVHRLEFGDDIVPHVPFKVDSFARQLIQRVVNQVRGDAGDLLRKLLTITDAAFEPVGPLTYATDKNDVHKDLSDPQAVAISKARWMHLPFAGSSLWEHHHMFNYLIHILGVNEDDANNRPRRS